MKDLTFNYFLTIIQKKFINIRIEIINCPENSLQGISSDSVLKLKKNIAVEFFGEKALILNLNNRAIIEFDTKESWLLQQINGRSTLKQLIDNYADEFSTTFDHGMQDIMIICDKLWDQQILCSIEGKPQGGYMDNTYYIQNPDVNIREEDEDGALLFNPDMDQVQLASKTGFYIWKLCAKECTVSDIVNTIKNDYDEVPEHEVISDVEEFINKMVESGFIGIVDK